MSNTIFKIKCISNLHVGSGDANFGLIDNLVQRDPVTNFPCIHGSGIKGALREHYGKSDDASSIFGSENKSGSTEAAFKGGFFFNDAYILSIPVRSDKAIFLRATCVQALQDLDEQAKAFGIALAASQAIEALTKMEITEPYVLESGLQNAILEEHDSKAVYNADLLECKVALEALLGKNIVILPNAMFQEIANDFHLPVIARNFLNNGQSENLWYEQVVPRQSQFFTIIGNNSTTALSDAFDTKVTGNQVVQLGGNATVGYGYCQFSKI